MNRLITIEVFRAWRLVWCIRLVPGVALIEAGSTSHGEPNATTNCIDRILRDLMRSRESAGVGYRLPLASGRLAWQRQQRSEALATNEESAMLSSPRLGVCRAAWSGAEEAHSTQSALHR